MADASKQPQRDEGSGATRSEKMPPAGPHAKPELTDKDKAPESGVLPDHDQKVTEAPTG